MWSCLSLEHFCNTGRSDLSLFISTICLKRVGPVHPQNTLTLPISYTAQNLLIDLHNWWTHLCSWAVSSSYVHTYRKCSQLLFSTLSISSMGNDSWWAPGCYVLNHFSRVWLWDPMDCSPPGSSVRGILQARILEWVAMPSFKGFSWLRDWTQVSYVLICWQVDSLPLVLPGEHQVMPYLIDTFHDASFLYPLTDALHSLVPCPLPLWLCPSEGPSVIKPNA